MWGVALLWLCTFSLGCGSSSDDDSPPEKEPLVQAVEPVISAVAIGVPDLEAATIFYRDTLGMEVLDDYPDYLDEEGMDITVLASLQQGRRGSLLVLMNDPTITDPAYYTDNPDKLVFRVPDGQAFYDAVLAAGGSEVGPGGTPPEQRYPQYPDLLIAMAYSPNGYLIEMLQVPPALANNVECTAPYITGVGIGVGDLEASNEFYTNTLGMVFDEDIPVEGFMDEKELVTPTGAIPSIVLMNYVDPQDYTDNPVKLVFEVSDAEGFFNVIRNNVPDQVVIPLETYPSGAISGYAEDLEGTTIQVVQPAP